ncbi:MULTISPECIES: hypothetical protein [unclassified Acidovorax]|uniref:hypothetical protein n=1 Tax=unclassified Acidovorax TaxID=2684926 RepID=UPI002882FE63|nr:MULTISPECIES: hypothetical protein [unclassified Acidovorax]
MLIFRWIVTLLLLTSGVSFLFYVGTGQLRYRRFGLLVLKWTVIAALFFFAVLILERIV